MIDDVKFKQGIMNIEVFQAEQTLAKHRSKLIFKLLVWCRKKGETGYTKYTFTTRVDEEFANDFKPEVFNLIKHQAVMNLLEQVENGIFKGKIIILNENDKIEEIEIDSIMIGELNVRH